MYYYIYVRLYFIHELLCTTVCTLSACKRFDPDSAKAQSRNVAKNRFRSIRIWTSTANCLSQNMSASPLEHTQGCLLMSGDLNLGVSPGQSGELLHASLKHGIWSHVFCSMAIEICLCEHPNGRQLPLCWITLLLSKNGESLLSTAFCTVSH